MGYRGPLGEPPAGQAPAGFSKLRAGQLPGPRRRAGEAGAASGLLLCLGLLRSLLGQASYGEGQLPPCCPPLTPPLPTATCHRENPVKPPSGVRPTSRLPCPPSLCGNPAAQPSSW